MGKKGREGKGKEAEKGRNKLIHGGLKVKVTLILLVPMNSEL